MALAKAIQEIKGNTSKWLNGLGARFAWQEGYSAFSVSQSQRQKVIDYIDGQAEHHKKWSFEQEFLSLLKKSGIAYDERICFWMKRTVVPTGLCLYWRCLPSPPRRAGLCSFVPTGLVRREPRPRDDDLQVCCPAAPHLPTAGKLLVAPFPNPVEGVHLVSSALEVARP
jgi:hypothetical protein